MKARDMQELSDEELQHHVDEQQRELFNLRIQKSTGQLENPARIRIVRRNLARARTIVHQREEATS